MTITRTDTIGVGDLAPRFVLSTIGADGETRLDDYVGRAPVFLNLMRGLHCAYCRRHLINLNKLDRTLKEWGIETLAVVSTQPERARMYFQYRPTDLVIASDPRTQTHRDYGLPRVAIDETTSDWPRRVTMAEFAVPRPDPTGTLSGLKPLPEFAEDLDRLDGYASTEQEVAADMSEGILLTGHFLIGRDGRIAWIYVEAPEGVAGFGGWLSEDQILGAAKQVTSA
jgi:peroxiredoxin